MLRIRDLAPLLGVVVCFVTASATLYAIASSLSRHLENGHLSFPKSLDELRILSEQLQQLKESHYHHVVGLFGAAYLYKQTFAIPGSVVMNILAGALFGLGRGLLLVCLLSASGATCCYLLSASFGKRLVWLVFKHHMEPLKKKLEEDHQSLLFLLISLRLFPMSPNWLLNLASPLLGIPLHLFFLSVLIGLMPYNLLCVQAGLVLSDLRGIAVLNVSSLLGLIGAAALLLGAGLVARRLRSNTSVKPKLS